MQRNDLRNSLPILGLGIDLFEEYIMGSDLSYSVQEEGEETIRLYSPYYVLEGSTIAGSVVTIDIYHSTQGTLGRLRPKIDKNGERQQELSLAKQTLYEGVHTVTVSTLSEGKETTKIYTLEVTYDRVQIGETILYLDTQFVPTGYDEDFLRETTSLEGNKRSFLTYGCDQDAPQPPVLIESYHQWQTVDACLSLSIPDEYLLFFEYQTRYEGEYLYTITSPSGVIRDIFPLFIHYDGTVVMNLPFWDNTTQRITSLAGWGSEYRPSLRLRSRNQNDGKPVYDIFVDDGSEVTVETAREKMVMNMYTDRDNMKSVVFPGSYYTYRNKTASGNRNKVNAGALTSAFPKKHGFPRVETYESTFTFDISIDGNILTVFDGFQETVFDLFAIGNTINTKKKSFVMDMPTVCETAELDIVRSHNTVDALQYPSQGTLMLVGRGWHANDLRIYHNSSTRMFRPSQLDQGLLRHNLQGSQFLTKGTNVYMIRVYDERGNELCNKRIAVKNG